MLGASAMLQQRLPCLQACVGNTCLPRVTPDSCTGSTRRRTPNAPAAQTRDSTTATHTDTADGQQQQEAWLRQWAQQSGVFYSNYTLQRAAEQRKDDATLAAWFTAPNAICERL
jgi:hypothetical protein